MSGAVAVRGPVPAGAQEATRVATPAAGDVADAAGEAVRAARRGPRGLLADAAERTGAKVHRGGTYICMEGPQFSSKGESELYRKWGMDIIGMTAMPEAKLAREAELCYATLACCTDYDCWHEDHDSVTVDMLIGNLIANNAMAKQAIVELIPTIPATRSCGCADALATAIVTQPDAIGDDVKERYGLLLEKYLS